MDPVVEVDVIGSLFSGIGGLELGLEAAGLGPVAWQVERDPFCRSILAWHWPEATRFDDVCTVGKHNLAPVDLICGGFPCQDISCAGKGAGLDGARSGLWREYARIVGELRPRFVVVENVSALLGRGADRVLGDLAALGYDAIWTTLRASDVGAPHRRERLFIVGWLADSLSDGLQGKQPARAEARATRRGGELADPGREGFAAGWSGGGGAETGALLDHRAPGMCESARVHPPSRGLRRGQAQGSGGELDITSPNGRQHYPQESRCVRARETSPQQRSESRARRDRFAALADQGVGDATGERWGRRYKQPRREVDAGRPGRTSDGRSVVPETQPLLGRDADGFPDLVDRWPAGRGAEQYPWEPPRTTEGQPQRANRLKALGNAVVPQVAYVVGCMVREVTLCGR